MSSVLDNADWIVYSDYYGYYYRQHATSIMHIFNPRRLDALKWARSIERFCAENIHKFVRLHTVEHLMSQFIYC